MGFISMVFAFLGILLFVLFFGIIPIVAGTRLLKKNQHKKLAVALRIFGYIVLIPTAMLILWWGIIYIIALFS